MIGIIAGGSSWSELYTNKIKNKPDSVFAHAIFYTEDEIRSWRIGGRLKIGKALYFSPHVKSAVEALDLENKQTGNPGFLVAKWVKK